jgi:RNA polymerase sigma-70 factor (ECF subfamily)
VSTRSETHVLADAAAHGDTVAFDRLVAEYHERVLNVAYRMVSRREDAEDICQEVFVKAFTALPRLRDRSQFGSWLLRITANCARDALRRRRRRKDDLDLDEIGPVPSDDDHARETERDDASRVVQRLLMGLPERHRIVLVLRDIEGLSYEEMAQALSCTVSSVKNRLHRARKLFRERLEPYVKADEV